MSQISSGETEKERLGEYQAQTPTLGKALLGIGFLSAFVASLCCVSPVFLVIFGLATVSSAIAFGNFLYSDYKLYFVAAGVTVMLASTQLYFKRNRSCRRSKKVRIRSFIIIGLATVLFYVVINTVITVLEWMATR